jgi:hypothetical protein
MRCFAFASCLRCGAILAGNFRTSILTNAPAHQFDVKIDHCFNDKQRVAVRYSQAYSEYDVPFVLAKGNFGDGQNSSTTVHRETA